MDKNCYFIPLGGGQQVGASCYFLKLGSSNVLLDCGIGYNNTLIFEPNIQFLLQTHFMESLSQISQVFVSHAHMDHIGNLPFLMNAAQETPLFMTETTKHFAYHQLYNKNFYAHYIKRGKEAERLALKYLFDKRIVTISYLQTLSFADYKATLYSAGHIPGAMMVLFEYKGKKILYTGDYSMNSTPLTEGCIVPNEKIDTVILCSLHAKDSFYKRTRKKLPIILDRMRRLLHNHVSIHCQITQLTKGIEFLELLNTSIAEETFPTVPIFIDEAIFSIVENIEKSLKPLIKKNVHSARLLKKNTDPCIYISTNTHSYYNFEPMRIDFSLHDDYQTTVDFIKTINPREVFIVHTAQPTNCDAETIETALLKDADCKTHCIFAENEEIYQLL